DPNTPIPCVLSAADATTIRERIAAFNEIIEQETIKQNGLLVKTNKFIDCVGRYGFQVGNRILTTDYLGGLYSLDGIHPSDVGYTIVANYFITRMNRKLNTKIPLANVANAWQADPLRPYAILTRPAGDDKASSCLAVE
ncbi:MAG TPA: hypothetical protein VE621_22910, partial [Bryobacteraceae bacterium]|nr:hypothetical protein [Bryobacteraceae bacterium]